MDYSAFVPEIQPEVFGCPIPLITRAIRESVRTFCRESTAYRLPPQSLSWSSGEYTITPPTGTDIETVVSPMVLSGTYVVDGQTYTDVVCELTGRSMAYLDANHPQWRTDVTSDYAAHFVMTGDNTFKITPDTGTDRRANLTVMLVLTPSRTSSAIDDEFGARWFDAIVAGAKYLLMVMPNKEWSSPELSQFYKLKWQDGFSKARAYIKTGYRLPIADGVKKETRSYFR